MRRLSVGAIGRPSRLRAFGLGTTHDLKRSYERLAPSYGQAVRLTFA